MAELVHLLTCAAIATLVIAVAELLGFPVKATAEAGIMGMALYYLPILAAWWN
jgi:hypothetical protein